MCGALEKGEMIYKITAVKIPCDKHDLGNY